MRNFTHHDYRKRCAGLLLMLLICIGRMLPAQDIRDQDILSTKVTITLKNVTFEQTLRQLTELTGIRFVFSPDHIADHRLITLEADNNTLGEILDQLLPSRKLIYRVHEKEKSIALTQAPGSEDGTASESQLRAGLVTDQTGTPMIGVSVSVRSTSRGTMSDANGRFSLNARAGEVLVFSYIGYAPQQREVGQETEMIVTLEAESSLMEEVVVNAGYWNVSKRDQTGNIARVTANDLEKQPVSNPLMGLQGRMPGVVVQQVSGVPGSGVRIQIRGQNSLRNTTADNGNLPLYVIDGVPVESAPVQSTGVLFTVGGIDPLNTINPANIESIEILKDADATSIYGSRAANGVVLITTKRGQSGRVSADVHVYAGVGKSSGFVDVLNTPQYLAMRMEAFGLDEVSPQPGDYDLNGTWNQVLSRNWQKELYGRTANLQDVQASVSGGNNLTSFRAGFGVHHETTVFPGDFGYRKMMGNLNVSHASQDQTFKLSLTINYGQDDNKVFNRNIVQDALTLPPNAPLLQDNGALDWTGYTTARPNPYSYFEVSHRSNSDNLIANARISYEILPGMTLSSGFGFTDSFTGQLIKTPQSSMNPDDRTDSRSSRLDYGSRTWIAEPQLGYSRTLLGGKLDVLIGTTWQDSRTNTFGIEGAGFTSDALLGNVRAARSIVIFRDDKSLYRYNAVFGRLAFNWKEKYLLNLTARRDGSSRFGTDNQFGNFAAVGAGWIFSEERLIREGFTPLSFGKIRASYGTTGSDRIGNYAYFSTYSPSAALYNNVSILYTTGLANPEFGWEVNKKIEIALDLGFLQDRIMFSVSAYRNRSSNQLVGYPLPATTGFPSVQYNLDATVQNSGLELELTAVSFRTQQFQWRTGFNVTIPRNKLVSYPGLEASAYAASYAIGQPLTISKRYKLTQVDPATGLYAVADTDQNGSITSADRTVPVDLGRDFFGGLTNTITFKGFELDFLVEFVRQQSSGYMNGFSSAPGTMYNQPARVLAQSRWQAEGDLAEIQRFSTTAGTPYSRMLASDYNVSDASYLRMKTLSLSWTAPQAFTRKAGLQNARIYIQGQNLFTVSPYEGLNPEFASTQLPPLRTITAGLILKI